MTALLSHLWVFLVLAALLGAMMDVVTASRLPKASDRPLATTIVVLVVAGIVLVLARLVPGRWGLAVEIGLALIAAYYVGAGVTTLARRRRPA